MTRISSLSSVKHIITSCGRKLATNLFSALPEIDVSSLVPPALPYPRCCVLFRLVHVGEPAQTNVQTAHLKVLCQEFCWGAAAYAHAYVQREPPSAPINQQNGTVDGEPVHLLP